jgi:hypothetical protein
VTVITARQAPFILNEAETNLGGFNQIPAALITVSNPEDCFSLWQIFSLKLIAPGVLTADVTT